MFALWYSDGTYVVYTFAHLWPAACALAIFPQVRTEREHTSFDGRALSLVLFTKRYSFRRQAGEIECWSPGHFLAQHSLLCGGSKMRMVWRSGERGRLGGGSIVQRSVTLSCMYACCHPSPAPLNPTASRPPSLAWRHLLYSDVFFTYSICWICLIVIISLSNRLSLWQGENSREGQRRLFHLRGWNILSVSAGTCSVSGGGRGFLSIHRLSDYSIRLYFSVELLED